MIRRLLPPTLLFSMATLVATGALAQVLPDTAANRARGVVGCVQSSSGISCGNRGGGGGGSGSSAYYQHQQFMNQMMVNTMQGLMNNFWAGYQQGMERRQRRQSALNLNNAGIAYANKGNWSAAVSSFRNALGYSDDPVIRKNLAWAEDELSGRAEARRKAERERRKKIGQMFNRLSDKLQAPPAERPVTGAKNELEFLTPKGTAFFGHGGEAPPPVDTREQIPDQNGLSFMSPEGQLNAVAAQSATATVSSGGDGAVQVASAEGGLQFLAPDTALRDAPAAVSKDASLHPDASSPKAAMLLDALALGDGNWDKSRDYLVGLQKKYPDDPNIPAAIKELDHVRKLASEEPAKPKAPSRYVAEMHQKSRDLISEGKFLEARSVLAKAYWTDPKQADIRNLLNATHLILVKEADEYKNQARNAVRRGSYQEAIMMLEAASARAPNDSAIDTQLKAIRTFDKDQDLLITALTGRENRLPIKPMMLTRDADRLIADGDHSGALRKLDEAAHLSPEDRDLRDRFFRMQGLLDAKKHQIGTGYGNLKEGHPYVIQAENAPRHVSAEATKLIDRADKELAEGNFEAAVADAREAQMYEPGNKGLVDYISYLQGVKDFDQTR